MDPIEARILQIIDQKADEIKAFGQDIWCHAEVGYREHRTAQKFEEALQGIGLQPRGGIAITGSKTYLRPPEEAQGPTIALMGELDALPMPRHPEANPETGAAHACGHCAQLTGVLGAAIALSDPEVKAAMAGNICFIGVPSEEFSSDVPYKLKLVEEGKIGCLGGKSEFIRLGELNDIDLTVGHHSWEGGLVVLNWSSNGFVNKTVVFKGRSAHGTVPDEGIDALEAAHLGVSCLNSQRETFRDEDCVRVHGMVVKGGDASNIIADESELDYSVRANNLPAIKNASYKFDRAMQGAATALGTGLELRTIAGYLPFKPIHDISILEEAVRQVAKPGDPVTIKDGYNDPGSHIAGSTDFGDVSQIMPVLQFGTSGYSGSGHTPSYAIEDPDIFFIATAKIFALIAYKLLKGDAAAAQKLIADYQAPMTRDDFLQYLQDLQSEYSQEMVPVPDFGLPKKK